MILIDWAEQLGIDDPLGHSVCRALTRVVANWTKAYETVNHPDFRTYVLEHKDGSPKSITEHLTELCEVYYEIYDVMIRYYRKREEINDHSDASKNEGDDKRALKASSAANNQATPLTRRRVSGKANSTAALTTPANISQSKAPPVLLDAKFPVLNIIVSELISPEPDGSKDVSPERVKEARG